MFQRLLLSIFLFVPLVLVACFSEPEPDSDDNAASPSPLVLPNLLVQVTGKIELWREGSNGFVPVALGAGVQPGDTLRLVDGEAAIFCGNETLWEGSPQPLPVDEEEGVPCLAGRSPRSALAISFLREPGEEELVRHEIPYVLSPRTGFILSERPTLRWHPLSTVNRYTVTLRINGEDHQVITEADGELPYPEEWPSLQADGTDYLLEVAGDKRRSDEEGTQGKGFTLLNAEQAAKVRTQAEHLSQRLSEDDLSLTLLLAELYLSDEYKLHSEAVELLLNADGDQVVAVQRLLGETYLAMGLLDEATTAYSQALTLAQNAELSEEEAAAHLGLGLAACARTNHEDARTHWQEAQKLYQEMGRATDEVDKLLAEADEKCMK